MFKVMDLLTKNRKIGFLVIFLLVLVSHGNIFQNQFVMDDFDFIVDWPLIQEWKNFLKFFVGYTPPLGQEGVYSPLKTVFHAVHYHLFGLNPIGHHVASLLIHCIGIYFVYRISLILTTSSFVAFVSSLIFALHPVQVEAITYMTASVDMIGIVFLFASFFWYLNIRDEQGRFKRSAYIMSLCLAALSIFTHELAISLPLLFLWYEFCFSKERGPLKTSILKTTPFFMLVACYVLSKFLVLKSITRGQYLHESFYLTMLVTIKAWAKYVYLSFFPNVLTHNHIISKGISSFDPQDFDTVAVLTQSILDPQILLALAVLGSIVFVAVTQFKMKPIITFCVGWFFIALLPVSNIIPSGVFFGERYLYPGLLGFCLLLGFLIEKLCHRNKPFLIIGFLLILFLTGAYSIRTWIRNRDWRNEVILYETTVQSNPQSSLMRTDLGIVYLKNKKPRKSLVSFQEALKIRPDDQVTYFSIAEAYLQIGHKQKAKDALYAAIDIDREYAEAYYNLAGVYASQKQMDKAKEHLRQSVYYYHKQGRTQEAKKLEKVFKEYFRLR